MDSALDVIIHGVSENHRTEKAESFNLPLQLECQNLKTKRTEVISTPQIKSCLIAGGCGVEAGHENAIHPILWNGGQISQQQD